MAKTEIFILVLTFLNSIQSQASWNWKCENYNCIRDSVDSVTSLNQSIYESHDVCRLTCNKKPTLWPIPTKQLSYSRQVITFDFYRIQLKYADDFPPEIVGYLNEVFEIFLQNIIKDCNVNSPDLCIQSTSDTNVAVNVQVNSNNVKLDWSTNESYSLQVHTNENQVQVNIIAETIYGVRHGLETLNQLIASYWIDLNKYSKGLVILTEAIIVDEPVYRHRGILLDTARNFMKVQAIKKQIDAMGLSKMNVLHWHATDSQSFPLTIPSLPNLTKYGALSTLETYTSDDITELRDYAKLRGVRIIVEIDAPSHSGNGWQWGPAEGLGNLAVCINKMPWSSYCIQPPCGQLNPANQQLYPVLGKLYGDIINYFPNLHAFHMGGDEIKLSCWNSTAEIVQYLNDSGRGRSTQDFIDLWADFQQKAAAQFDQYAGHNETKFILWTSQLTDDLSTIEKHLDKNRYVIQPWLPSSDPTVNSLLDKGYQLIISTKDAWYLDHGFWGTTKYYQWDTVYNNKIPLNNLVLGGEVCMWSERVESDGLDSRMWPRTAAAAERLWSNPGGTESRTDLIRRFYHQHERLLGRGINSNPIDPQWCVDNDGQC